MDKRKAWKIIVDAAAAAGLSRPEKKRLFVAFRVHLRSEGKAWETIAAFVSCYGLTTRRFFNWGYFFSAVLRSHNGAGRFNIARFFADPN